MSKLEKLYDKVLANVSPWVEIADSKSIWTIEDFPYETGVDEKKTSPHCWRCVTINHCWFKNEKEKMPEEFDYTKNFLSIFYLNKGLYHPNCHCEKQAIDTPNIKNKKFLATSGKIDYFFKDKINWFYAWGYLDKDKNDFIEKVLNLSYQSYIDGKYEKIEHNQYGFKINIFIELPGINEKKEKFYKIKTCWTIFPNGTLKCNTLIGGRLK